MAALPAGVVVVDAAEWSSVVETLHLFSSPANARRLLDAMDDIEAGNVTEFDPQAAESHPAPRTPWCATAS